MKTLLLIILLYISAGNNSQSSIVGVWINEQDPKLTWEFNTSGQLIEKYGDVLKVSPRVPSTYQILNRSQSCSEWNSDKQNQTYLKIVNTELGSFCYYLETLSSEVLVLINADTGKMLIFNKTS